jgi:hypothetical protein
MAQAPRPGSLGDDYSGEEQVTVGDVTFRLGGTVLLRPGAGGTAEDAMLAGRSATIERILIDYDDAVHLAVTVDGDPGQELMREMGRYLFFKPHEVEVTAG